MAIFPVSSGGGVAPAGGDDCLILSAPSAGTEDASPALGAFLIALMASPRRRGYIPTGTYRLDSALPEIITHINLFGDCNARSILLRNYNGAAGKGVLTIAPGAHGCVLAHFGISAVAGTYGGAGLAILASAAQNCDRILLDSILLSASTDLWSNSLLVDGSQKTSTPVGIRGLKMRDCDIFGANGYSAAFYNAPGVTWIGGGMYPAGGSNSASGQYTYTGYAPKLRGVYGVPDAG